MHPQLNSLVNCNTIMFEYDVHDMNRAVGWYRDIFGFPITFGPTHCHTEFALPLPGSHLALSLADASIAIRKGPRLFLATADIQAMKTYLKEKGAKTLPIENTDNVVLILWVQDPEGNYLAIQQRLTD